MHGSVRLMECRVVRDNFKKFISFLGIGQMGDANSSFSKTQAPRIESSEFCCYDDIVSWDRCSCYARWAAVHYLGYASPRG